MLLKAVDLNFVVKSLMMTLWSILEGMHVSGSLNLKNWLTVYVPKYFQIEINSNWTLWQKHVRGVYLNRKFHRNTSFLFITRPRDFKNLKLHINVYRTSTFVNSTYHVRALKTKISALYLIKDKITVLAFWSISNIYRTLCHLFHFK